MIYLGGSWPEKYRGQAFMNNIHGARINMDVLDPKGSGYVGKHGADFLLFNDVWSQIVNLQYDQDGRFIRRFGGRGDADEQFQTPHGITVDYRPPEFSQVDEGVRRAQYDGLELRYASGGMEETRCTWCRARVTSTLSRRPQAACRSKDRPGLTSAKW